MDQISSRIAKTEHSKQTCYTWFTNHAPVLVVVFAIITAISSVFVHLVIRHGFLDNMDERNYLWLANRILEGRVTCEPPPKEIAQHFKVPWRAVFRNREYTHYSVTWPAILAVGGALKAPWIVNPILSGLAVLILYSIVDRLYNERLTSLVTVFLFFFSPFLVYQAGTMLSHVSTLFFILLGILSLIYADKQSNAFFTSLGGIIFGIAFTIRPLDTVAVVLPIFCFFAVSFRDKWSIMFKHSAFFIIGGLIGLVPFWLYNLAVTGDPWLTPLQL